MYHDIIPHIRRNIMTKHPIKTKLHPFRVLALLLYSQQDYLVRLGEDTVEVRVGPLARSLRVPNYRLKGYVDWLKRAGYLEEVTHEIGYFTARLKYPRNISK
jgi:hypothetical protein